MADPYRFLLRKTGGPEALEVEAIDLPRPGEGEVLIRHEAIGLNFIDTYHRSGLYPLPLPSGIGNEAAGIVEAVGPGVEAVSVGNRIGYFSGPLGSYATHRTLPADRIVKLPNEIESESAAAMLLKGCTAEFLIERCARVEAEETVLVHAAAGGVGSILVQWLKAIGATVIAHSGSSPKAEMVKTLGADHSLCCPMDELAGEVRSITSGKGVSVILDGVGAASWEPSLGSMAPRGLLVTFGNASGPVPPFTALDLLRTGSIFVTRPTLFDYIPTSAEMRNSAARVFEMIQTGSLKVQIGARYPLPEAAAAHRALEERKTTGSTILLP
jgi:NADPH2:quinone reductase